MSIQTYFQNLADGDNEKYNELLTTCREILNPDFSILIGLGKSRYKPILLLNGTGNNGKTCLINNLVRSLIHIYGDGSVKNVSVHHLNNVDLGSVKYVVLRDIYTDGDIEAFVSWFQSFYNTSLLTSKNKNTNIIKFIMESNVILNITLPMTIINIPVVFKNDGNYNPSMDVTEFIDFVKLH